MSSEQAVQKFIERVQQSVNMPGVLVTGVAGTTSKQSVQLDLLRTASLLPQANKNGKLDEQIQEVIGVLHVAQAMNAIGTDDLIELMELLEKINESNME